MISSALWGIKYLLKTIVRKNIVIFYKLVTSMSPMMIDSRFSLSIDCNVFDKKKLKFFDNFFEDSGGLWMVPKMKGFVYFNRISTQRDSVSSFSRSVHLAKSIPFLMYNPTPPPLFRSRLIKLYPRISKKAFWKLFIVDFEQVNVSWDSLSSELKNLQTHLWSCELKTFNLSKWTGTSPQFSFQGFC